MLPELCRDMDEEESEWRVKHNMCSIYDTEDIALKRPSPRPSPNVVLEVKHKVCSILDTVTLHLKIIG